MDQKERIWEMAQEMLGTLVGEGKLSMAIKLQEALDESKRLGQVTYKLLHIHSSALLNRANRVIGEAGLESLLHTYMPFQKKPYS